MRLETIRTVQYILKKLEGWEDFKILYACEGSSRIYGFKNGHSDYSVRFIFLKDTTNYLLNNFKDTFEKTVTIGGDVFDIVGWDFRKMLNLYGESNYVLKEWIESPIKYKYDSYGIFKDLPPFQTSELFYHYKSEAEKLYKKYKVKDNLLINCEEYLHIFRCLYSCKYIEETFHESGYYYPPLIFQELIDSINLDSLEKTRMISLLNSLRGLSFISQDDLEWMNTYIENYLFRLDFLYYGVVSIPPDYRKKAIEGKFLSVLKEINQKPMKKNVFMENNLLRMYNKYRDTVRVTSNK